MLPARYDDNDLSHIINNFQKLKKSNDREKEYTKMIHLQSQQKENI